MATRCAKLRAKRSVSSDRLRGESAWDIQNESTRVRSIGTAPGHIPIGLDSQCIYYSRKTSMILSG